MDSRRGLAVLEGALHLRIFPLWMHVVPNWHDGLEKASQAPLQRLGAARKTDAPGAFGLSQVTSGPQKEEGSEPVNALCSNSGQPDRRYCGVSIHRL